MYRILLHFCYYFLLVYSQLGNILAICYLQQQKQHQNFLQRQPKMSKCHFPQDLYTIILDNPSISNINNTLRLIQTNNNICTHSFLSFTCFDKPTQSIKTKQLLLNQDEDSQSVSIMNQRPLYQSEQELSGIKKKKTGCTCKKTNCIKMYCECFAAGKMCTPECACFGCHNHSQHQTILQKAKCVLKNKSLQNNRFNSKGCNCKKTKCQKKYCQCYNAGLVCTELCNCCDCCNKYAIDKPENNSNSEQLEEQQIN